MRIRHPNVFVDLNPYVLITVAIKYVEKQVQAAGTLSTPRPGEIFMLIFFLDTAWVCSDDCAKPFLVVEDMYNMEGPETKPCALGLEKVIRYTFMNCVSC